MDLTYYRIPCNRAGELQKQVQTMQTRLAKKYRIVTKPKRRPKEREERHTRMEVYRNIPQNFDRIEAQSGLPQLINGERHTEYFLDLSACA